MINISYKTRGRLTFLGLLVAGLIVAITISPGKAGLVQPSHPEDWGTLIDVPFPTNYSIYTQNFAYAEPFLVTDLRSSDTNPIEHHNMHTLDIYRPAIGDELLENRPVIFFVHGGGWIGGYKEWFRGLSWSFTGQMGWIMVVIDYRLTSDDVFLADQYCPDRATCRLPENETLRSKAAEYPANIQDVASAFGWTRDWIGEQGGDPDLIFGLGYSAGAHLITLMTMHPDYTYLRPYLRASAALSGPYDLTASAFKDAYMHVLAPTFGLPLQDAELADASPQTQVGGIDWLPPMMLLYAENDLPYLDEHTLNLAESIQGKQMPVEVVYLEGYDHNSESGALRYVNQYPTRRIIEFFESFISPVNFLPMIRQSLVQ